MSIVWLALIVIFLIVEIATVGLTSIWLAGGALAALVVELLGLGIVWQIAAFLIVTFILLYFTRPWAQKYLNAKSVKTNYESLIGQKIKMTEQVDNLSQTGKQSSTDRNGRSERKQMETFWNRAISERYSGSRV